MWILFVLLAAVVMPGCGKRHIFTRSNSPTSIDALNQIPGSSDKSARPGRVINLDEALINLRGLEAPPGVNREELAGLKAELERLLVARGLDRFPSKAPSPDSGNVIQLTPDRQGLRWNEARAGDWDNDGAVTAKDIVPIAAHFGKDDDPESSDYYKYASYLDWDGDRRIGTGDLQPVAFHFGESTGGYSIYEAENLGGGGKIRVATIKRPPVPSDPENVPLQRSLATLQYDTSSGLVEPSNWVPVEGKWYQVVPFDSSVLFEESDSLFSVWVQASVFLPIAKAKADPNSGYAPLMAHLTGAESNDPDGRIVLYEWDFETDGKYDWSSSESGETYHAYDQSGTFKATLRVTDDAGLTSAATAVIIVARSERGDWWMYGHDPAHTFRSQFPGPQSARLKWQFEAGGNRISSPAIAVDGTIYFTNFDEPSGDPTGKSNSYLYAIGPANTLKWRYFLPYGSVTSPAVALDGSIYLGSYDGYVYAIDPGGSLMWRFRTDKAILSSPALGLRGTVYIASSDEYLYALAPDGSLEWRYEIDGYGDTVVAIGPDGTVYATGSGSLFAIGSDGSLKWRNKNIPGGAVTPSIARDGTIYLAFYPVWTPPTSPPGVGGGAYNFGLYALTPSGSLKWEYDIEEKAFPLAIGEDGTIYVAGEAGYPATSYYLDALSPEGIRKWRTPTRQVLTSMAIDCKGTIYGATAAGDLIAIASDGIEEWSSNIGLVLDSLAIGPDKVLYGGGSEGYLYAFSESDLWPQAVITATPTFGQLPLTVGFDSTASFDPDGTSLSYLFDFEGDGAIDESNRTGSAQHTYSLEGIYSASVTVIDDTGHTDTATVKIEVGSQVGGWVHTWGGSVREESKALAIDANGNIYIAGNLQQDFYLPGYILLLKYDATGKLVWSKRRDSNNSVTVTAIAVDPNGDIYVAGFVDWRLLGSYNREVLLLKLDAEGNLLWERTWGGDKVDEASALVIDSRGNVLLTGRTTSFGAGSGDLLLLEFSSRGDPIRARTYGGYWSMDGRSILLDSDGNLVIAGEIIGGTLVFKANWSWDVLWAESLNLDLLNSDESVSLGPYNSIYLGGEIRNSLSKSVDPVLLRIDRSGNLIWATSWLRSSNEEINAVASDRNFNVYAVGFTGTQELDSRLLVLKYDSLGKLLSQSIWDDLNAEDYFYGVKGYACAVGTDGGLYVGGSALNSSGLWRTGAGADIHLKVSAAPILPVVTSPTGSVGIPSGTLYDAVGMNDIGGGNYDALLLKMER